VLLIVASSRGELNPTWISCTVSVIHSV
jgi:hypothetical protein